jgi:hypothetical protein
MLGTNKYFAQAQSCQCEAVFGGACLPPLFANCGDKEAPKHMRVKHDQQAPWAFVRQLA